LKNIWVASNLIKCDSAVVHNMGGRNLFQSGGTSGRHKTTEKFLRFEVATVTSQALKYDVITYTP